MFRRQKGFLAFVVGLGVFFALAGVVAASETPLVLTGKNLTIEDIVSVAVEGRKVAVSEEAMKNVSHSYDTVMKAAVEGMPVYGLTVGVGWNKDRPVFTTVEGKKVLSDELLNMSKKFNIISLRAHCAGVGSFLPVEVVRAGMLSRLNQFLTGIPGVQPYVVKIYERYLNEGITPLVPSKGTVGQADITLSSHIGLAMVGEWDVLYKGERMPALEVMKALQIEPLVPVGKDFLSILSTNALALGQAALAVAEAGHFLEISYPAFGLFLEGYNGNVAPFMKEVAEIRPFEGYVEAAEKMRKTLEGSYLYKPSETRAMQDPLSIRSMAYTLGNVEVALKRARAALILAVNHTDDNPAVIWDAKKGKDRDPQTSRYFLGDEGAIFPTANFEILPVVRELDSLNVALAQMSNRLVMQTIRLEDPKFTNLTRFLSDPENPGHAFGAIQKPLVEMDTENRMLAAPTQLGAIALAGNIEDTAGCTLISVRSLEQITENLYGILSLQLLHSTQAVDLRKSQMKDELFMAETTQKLYDAYRKVVPFVDQDRPFTKDIAEGIEFLKNMH
ncbi:HAL/PAL/TAL family ammonia-lyase [Aminiphilus circumscriptus]|jgi:histidine ammonia-lyase|uniref:HAL/PAL/TAL family ammonia-lyase n=1 Tax=Aminiphilus circumscriptus TaxID=290732 RepID=UPI000478666F|nr:aromatic amino acid ammonia-lyase [Aminiphilus circumscriptus]